MKPVAICALIGGGVFFAALMQLGGFNGAGRNATSTDQSKSAPKPPRAKFPEELMPAVKAHPVEKAADYKRSLEPHKMAFLTVNGELHTWHNDIPEAWQADTVEDTEIVVVVGKERGYRVQTVHYRNGPPIERWLYEAEVSVVEAKTGYVLDNRMFRNEPRPCRDHEVYNITVIGRELHWGPVFRWISERTKIGFPSDGDPQPVVTIID